MLLEEGPFLDAVKVGIQTGFKAFCKEREQQKAQTEEKALIKQLQTAEGPALKAVVHKLVEKDYTFRQGKVQKTSTQQRMLQWLEECRRMREESMAGQKANCGGLG